MIEQIFHQAEDRMKKVIAVTKQEFNNIRTGRASVQLLDGVKVEYYNSLMPINQLASVSTPDARTITIQPWDKGAFSPIETAITKAGLGLTPVNDGNLIRISIPYLTEERRRELSKLVHKTAEDQKVSIRNIRRDVNDEIKELKKKSEISEDDNKKALEKVQHLTDKYIVEIDNAAKSKERDIMES
ncbi:MAG: ribosome recycling factor [Candidatus Firestonebacteria bacterium]|nr:ribosome recycling factor [Candidatus Firestonebacteria bacterium]